MSISRTLTMPLLFLSHAGTDTEAARMLKKRIEEAPAAREVNLKVWLDKDELRSGESWQDQLEVAIEKDATAFAVYLGSGGVVNWVEREVRLALSRATSGNGRFPFVPIISAASAGSSALPGFARQFHGVRDIENRPEEFQKLLAAVLGINDTGSIKGETEPFFGLKAIDEKRSHLFFGREREADELLALLRDRKLLMVVGDSGSGKSSLVRAGLVPKWRGGALAELEGRRPNEDIWHVIEMRPGGHPRRSLGDAVFKAAGALGMPALDRGTYQTWTVGNDPELRRSGLRCGLDPDRARTLIVVDQFEELVTQSISKEERQEFAKLLTSLIDGDDNSFSIVLTMRRDYYNLLSASEFRDIYGQLEMDNRKSRYLLSRMTDEGLRQIVEKPLSLAGVDRSDYETLAQTVLQDTGDRPGDLALVQFALTKTWERRHDYGDDLLRAYVAVGRVDGALAREAERVFQQVLGGEKNEPELAATLIRLARLGGTGGPTRRVAQRREFSDVRWKLLQILASPKGNRLVLIRVLQADGDDNLPNKETVEIAHEALLTRWPKLHAWLNEAPDEKRTLDRLTERAIEWSDAETTVKDRQLARTDAEREAFVRIARARPLWLSKDEVEFVNASENDYIRRRRRDKIQRAMTQASAILSFILFVVAIIYWLEAKKQATNADQQAQIAKHQAQEAIRQRNLAVFSVDAIRRIAAPVSGELLKLADITRAAIESTSPLDQARAYLAFAHYHRASNDPERAKPTLSLADNHVTEAENQHIQPYETITARSQTEELYGDLYSRNQDQFPEAVKKYEEALDALESQGNSEPDQIASKARLMYKIASVYILGGDMSQAEGPLKSAEEIINNHMDSARAVEVLAGINRSIAELALKRGASNDADRYFSRSSEFFRNALLMMPDNNQAAIDLAITLMKQGDLRRRTGKLGALSAYNSALELLDRVIADDPTSFDALSTRDLARHGVRLLGQTAAADTIEMQKKSSISSNIDREFGSGIGRFRFGMSLKEINHLLKDPFDDSTFSDPRRALEFKGGDVRYIWKWLRDEPDLKPYSFNKDCILSSAYVVFLFHEDRLLRIGIRTMQGTEPCQERANVIDEFARKYGIFATGANDVRRFRYETKNVGMAGYSDSYAVTLDFTQR